MRPFFVICLTVIAACSSATDPVAHAVVVPAGASDPNWAAIGKTCTPSSSVSSIARVRLDSAPPLTHGPIRSVDDDWSDLARDTPGGFAGLILENNVPVVFLTDTMQKSAALPALAAKHLYNGNLAGARVRAARWNFMQLAEWFRYFQSALPAPIISADIDEAKNRITFGVPDSAARKTTEQLLAKLDVPCYLVGLDVEGIPVLLERSSRPLQSVWVSGHRSRRR
jgi:hypothetical protein